MRIKLLLFILLLLASPLWGYGIFLLTNAGVGIVSGLLLGIVAVGGILFTVLEGK